MEDSDETVAINSRRLQAEGHSHPLQQQMRAFISKHGSATDLKTLREEVATGKPISEIVTKERNGRT